MPTLKRSLNPETDDALDEAAASHLRSPDWHAQALLRQGLGLPFTYPMGADEPKAALGLDMRDLFSEFSADAGARGGARAHT